MGDVNKRHVMFCASRFHDMMRKAQSMVIQCNARVGLIVYPPNNVVPRVYAYPNMQNVLAGDGFEAKDIEITPRLRFQQALASVNDVVIQMSTEDLEILRLRVNQILTEVVADRERRL